MRVLLVNPRSTDDATHSSVPLNPYVPYGLLYIGAVLEKAGHDTRILDRNAECRNPGEVIRQFQPDIVGISAMTGPCLVDAISISESAKEINKKIKVIWGGVHPSLFPEQILTEPSIDMIVNREGELTIIELLDILQSGGNPETVNGIYFKKNNTIVKTEDRPMIKDINILPDPAWHLIDVEKYIVRSKINKRNSFTMNTSRGCPYKCTFCYNQKFDNNWRALNAERILRQVLYLQSTYNVNYINFLEDNFTVNKNRVREVCNLLIEQKVGLKWECESRIAVLDKKILELMRSAGCHLIGFGIESGSPKILKMIKKQITIDQIKETLHLCKKAGIWTDVYFMAGFPDEQLEDLDMTVTLLKKVPYKRADFMVYRPYPGSELYEYCLDKGLFSPPQNMRDWGDISDVHSTKYSVGNISELVLNKVMLWNQKRNKVKHINYVLSEMPLRDLIKPTTLYKGLRYLKSAYSNS